MSNQGYKTYEEVQRFKMIKNSLFISAIVISVLTGLVDFQL